MKILNRTTYSSIIFSCLFGLPTLGRADQIAGYNIAPCIACTAEQMERTAIAAGITAPSDGSGASEVVAYDSTRDVAKAYRISIDLISSAENRLTYNVTITKIPVPEGFSEALELYKKISAHSKEVQSQ